MSCETLYDGFIVQKTTDDLTLDEKDELVKLVETFTKEQREIFYTLILHHHSKSTPATKVIYPYKIKQATGDRVEIKLDALPNQLKQILYKFAKVAANK